LLACREALSDGDGIVLFIGDHPTDTECAIEANRALKESGERPNVVAVAACFGAVCDTEEWHVRPHHVARHPKDIMAIVERVQE
jgi:phosphoglycolate phosphatase-like HAD superfamily hydrolase